MGDQYTVRLKRRIRDQVEEQMGAGLSAEHILNGVGAIFGDSPALFMVQFDNGYLVYFHPVKVRVGNGDVGLTGYATRGPHGGMGMGAAPTPEEEREMEAKARERRRSAQEARERSKDRIRVYPALSQALEEIKKFYASGGVVPGVDFVTLSEKNIAESDGMIGGPI